MREWVSVEERLPRIETDVWVTLRGAVTFGHRVHCPGYWHIMTDEGEWCAVAEGITHWMSMSIKPEPPKVEAGGGGTMSKWISVEERLPDAEQLKKLGYDDEAVLVWGDDGSGLIRVAYFDQRDWVISHVTHWMPYEKPAP